MARAGRRMPTRVLLDANILVILAYGAVDRSSLGSRRRVREYMHKDFDLATDSCWTLQASHRHSQRDNRVFRPFPRCGRWTREGMAQGVPAVRRGGSRGGVRPQPESSGPHPVRIPWDCRLFTAIAGGRQYCTSHDRCQALLRGARINPHCMSFNHYRNFYQRDKTS